MLISQKQKRGPGIRTPTPHIDDLPFPILRPLCLSPGCLFLFLTFISTVVDILHKWVDRIHRKVYITAVDVRALRKKLGISRDTLAREIGMSYKSVYLWEKGKTKPSALALEKLKELEISYIPPLL